MVQKSKKQSKADTEGGSGDDYAAAEKEFKLKWLKCVMYINVPCTYMIYIIINSRSGALMAEDLEEKYGEDVEFLFAKLKLTQENKEVCTQLAY